MSNLAIMNDEVLTMSSKEIADLVGKDHHHVIRDIKVMLDDPDLDDIDFKGISLITDDRGYTSLAHLDKEATMTLITGYSRKLRLMVIRRWQELESKNSLPDFNNPVIAARAWADEVEKNQRLLGQVKELEPKAKFYDDVAEAVNCVDIGAFGKSIGLSRNATFQKMREIGVLLKQGSSNVPYQAYIDKGYFVVIENVVEIGNMKKAIPQTMVTGKGQVFLHNLLKSEGYAVNDEQQDLL